MIVSCSINDVFILSSQERMKTWIWTTICRRGCLRQIDIWTRLNVFSKPDILYFVCDTLRDTPEFKTTHRSCFGQLFDILVNRCPISCKLLHALICRQLTTKKKVLNVDSFWWTATSRLSCEKFPESYDPDTTIDVPGDQYWKKLIGEDKKMTVGDVSEIFRLSPDMPRLWCGHVSMNTMLTYLINSNYIEWVVVRFEIRCQHCYGV